RFARLTVLFPRSNDFYDLKQVIPPRRHVEEQAAGVEFVAAALVAGRRQQVAQQHLLAGQVRQRQADEALTLRRAEMDAGEQAALRPALPGEGDELVPRRVAVPRLDEFAQRPPPGPHLRPLQALQQPLVELAQPGVDGLGGAPAEVDRDVDAPAL